MIGFYNTLGKMIIMNAPKIKLFPVDSKRIFYNIEYSLSRGRKQFLLLTGIIFTGLLLLFLTTSWYSISTTRGPVFGKAIGDLNYASFEPAFFSIISYWQSPAYNIVDKIDNTLNTPIVVFGSYDPTANLLTGGFQLSFGMLVGILSMSILLGLYTNLWLLTRKSGCKIGRAAKGTGALAGIGGGASGTFSMLIMAGCCGGTGISFLLFSLPLIGSFLSSYYANIDTLSILLIAIPSNLLTFGLIMFMASKLQVSTEVKTKELVVISDWFKVAIYLIVPAFLLFVFVLGVYWWGAQSITVLKSGMVGGSQNMTISIYTTLPLSASLFLIAGLIQLRRIFLQTKPKAHVNEAQIGAI